MHITEGCEEGLPNNNIATDVQQSAAGPVADGDATPLVHEALTREEPAAGETGFVETGCPDAELLAESKEKYGVDP